MPKPAKPKAAAAESDPNDPRSALSIRQPWAEMILRGTKKMEYRSRKTNVRGPVYLYASLTRAVDDDECQKHVGCTWEELDRGKLVGIIRITGCRKLANGDFGWVVEPVKRLDKPIKPIKPETRPMPSFFYPFRQRGSQGADGTVATPSL
jgi:hypothetical protein